MTTISNLLTALFFISTLSAFGQKKVNEKALFVHAEFQPLKYNYFTVGLGFQPKKTFVQIARKVTNFTFIGWTLSYNKTLSNSDWGLALQYLANSGNFSGPIGLGLETNYKSVDKNNHFCLKPLIGLSFPVVSIMYGYNFDFYGIKSERVSQHELILGLRLLILKLKK